MTQNIDFDGPTSTDPEPLGLSHPTVEVEYPDGTEEDVEPDYEVFVAVDPKKFYGPVGLDETSTTHIELPNPKPVGDLEETTQKAIEEGFMRFVQDGGSVDALIEKVYTRTVGDNTDVCLVIRSPHDEATERSRLALCVDEALREYLRIE